MRSLWVGGRGSLEDVEEPFKAGFEIEDVGGQSEVGRRRGFIGRRDSGQCGYRTATSATVKAFGITRLANLEGNVEVHFHEAAWSDLSTHRFPVLPERGNQGRNHGDAGQGDEPGDFSGAPDVLASVFGRIPQVGAQALPQIVAVEDDRGRTEEAQACGEVLSQSCLS